MKKLMILTLALIGCGIQASFMQSAKFEAGAYVMNTSDNDDYVIQVESVAPLGIPFSTTFKRHQYEIIPIAVEKTFKVRVFDAKTGLATGEEETILREKKANKVFEIKVTKSRFPGSKPQISVKKLNLEEASTEHPLVPEFKKQN